MKKKFTFNLWEVVDIERVNEELDTKVNGIPSDIQYKCLKVAKDGDITIEADFICEEV